MGSATFFAPHSIHTSRQTNLVQRVIATVAGWLSSRAGQSDAAGLSNALRLDLGFAPHNLPVQPFSSWRP